MEPSFRVVTRTPLGELWRLNCAVIGPREGWLSREDIREQLRLGPVEFVIADLGMPLKCISISDCHKFWKSEVKPHLAEPDAKARLEDFPNEYFYFASRWRDRNSRTLIVLLEKHH